MSGLILCLLINSFTAFASHGFTAIPIFLSDKYLLMRSAVIVGAQWSEPLVFNNSSLVVAIVGIPSYISSSGFNVMHVETYVQSAGVMNVN